MGKFDRPQPRPNRILLVKVRSIEGDLPVEGATVEFVGINWGTTDANGEVRIERVNNQSRAVLLVSKVGYKTYEGDYDIHDADMVFPISIEKVVETPIEPVEPLPGIERAPIVKVSGIHFTFNNHLGRIQEVSNFKGLRHFIDDIEKQKEFLKVFRQLNYNTVRVFINLSWGRISAKEEPDYYTKVDNYFDFLGHQGFICECGILQDCIDLGITKPEAQDIVAKVTEIAAKYQHVICHNNEPGKNLPANSSPSDFSGFVHSNVIYSHGSRISLDDVIKPVQDYIDEHTNRDEQWWRRGKDIKDISDIYGVPVLMNEPMGADNIQKPGSRSNIPREFLVYSAISSLFGGSCFHSTKTAFSEIPDSIEMECAKQYAEGFNLIEKEWMLGDYSALHLDGPLQLIQGQIERAYFKIRGNQAIGALSVGIPGRPSEFTLKNGWRIKEHRNDVVKLFER